MFFKKFINNRKVNKISWGCSKLLGSSYRRPESIDWTMNLKQRTQTEGWWLGPGRLNCSEVLYSGLEVTENYLRLPR